VPLAHVAGSAVSVVDRLVSDGPLATVSLARSTIVIAPDPFGLSTAIQYFVSCLTVVAGSVSVFQPLTGALSVLEASSLVGWVPSPA
jgi:hypothetical protein